MFLRIKERWTPAHATSNPPGLLFMESSRRSLALAVSHGPGLSNATAAAGYIMSTCVHGAHSSPQHTTARVRNAMRRKTRSRTSSVISIQVLGNWQWAKPSEQLIARLRSPWLSTHNSTHLERVCTGSTTPLPVGFRWGRLLLAGAKRA